MRSDSDIKRDVEDELRWDPDVDSTDIAVTVKNGVVTLAGQVDTPEIKAKAAEIARNVPKVTRVVDNLQVTARPTGSRPRWLS